MGRAEDLFERLESGGESALDEFIATRQSEELFLDFKRSSDDGSGRRLSDKDRNNLAKAISGFGNSEGGVVVWGIDCSRDIDGADVARTKVPLTDAARFLSWLEGAISGCTVPPHQGIRHHAIVIGSGPGGYVATLVPGSDAAPHQVVGRMIYYIRAGSDFVPTPHAVLAGMFGRRPQPHVFPSFSIEPAVVDRGTISFKVGVMIRNEGPGIAADLFVNILASSMIGDQCDLGFQQQDLNNWIGTWSFGHHMSLISRPELRVPPQAHVQPLVIHVSIAPPFEIPFKISGIGGAGSSPPYHFTFFKDTDAVRSLYEELVLGERSADDLKAFARRLLDQPEE